MPLIDVVSLVDEFNIGPLQVERRGSPTKDAFGNFVQGTPTIVTLNPVSAHNLDGRDLDQFPDSDENTEIVQFYTKVRLFVGDDSQESDVVTYNSKKYRIIRVQDYNLQGGVFWAFGELE